MARSSKTIPTLLALLSLTSLGLLQCNRSNCEDLRNELTAQKTEWSKCSRNEECVIVGGNTGDCSGILSCNFAVHRVHRLTAERRVASLPEESVDCMACNSPNCESGDLAFCEPVSGRCMIVTDLVEPEAEGEEASAVQSLTKPGDPDPDEPMGEGGQGSFGNDPSAFGGQAGAAP